MTYKIKPVKAFKTSDGVLHESMADAKEVQVKIDFYEWYTNSGNSLQYECDRGWQDFEGDELYLWLIQNRKVVKKLLEDTA